jgi:hypothetical protein
MPHQLDDRCTPAGDLISVDVLANILGYLDGPKDIMQKRRVCKKWKEAVKKTIVPTLQLSDMYVNPNYFRVDDLKDYNAMRLMTTEMPNLQQIMLGRLGIGHRYNDGEDPEEYAIPTLTALDIAIISNFSKLRIMGFDSAPLNGRYPFLFNSFPLLQKLSFQDCDNLKWDLEMLAGLPLLKELVCYGNDLLTGNISSLRVLKETLEKVEIFYCNLVEGNLLDLANFPHLKELDLDDTAVTGDIRDIGENGFSSLECLRLPKGVYGGNGYELQRISDAPDVVRAVYLFNKQRPALLKMKDWFGILSRNYPDCSWFLELSEDSPDWYESVEEGYPNDTAPFYIRFVEAGSRIGYRWETKRGNPCEVNWLDPEPDRESGDYGRYIEEMLKVDRELYFYKGFHQPPTEDEYHRLFQEY